MSTTSNRQTLMPCFNVNDGHGFVGFVQKVFNGNVTYMSERPDGSIAHCQMNIEGQTIMLGSSSPEWEPRNCDIFIYVDDADATYQKALDNGATTVMGLSDQDYGRTCGVKDAEGNIWTSGPGGILILSPEGKLLGKIETAGENASNCAWGNDGSMLYITVDGYLCRIKTNTKGANW